jgi:hypothetical protein
MKATAAAAFSATVKIFKNTLMCGVPRTVGPNVTLSGASVVMNDTKRRWNRRVRSSKSYAR